MGCSTARNYFAQKMVGYMKNNIKTDLRKTGYQGASWNEITVLNSENHEMGSNKASRL